MITFAEQLSWEQIKTYLERISKKYHLGFEDIGEIVGNEFKNDCINKVIKYYVDDQYEIDKISYDDFCFDIESASFESYSWQCFLQKIFGEEYKEFLIRELIDPKTEKLKYLNQVSEKEIKTFITKFKFEYVEDAEQFEENSFLKNMWEEESVLSEYYRVFTTCDGIFIFSDYEIEYCGYDSCSIWDNKITELLISEWRDFMASKFGSIYNQK